MSIPKNWIEIKFRVINYLYLKRRIVLRDAIRSVAKPSASSFLFSLFFGTFFIFFAFYDIHQDSIVCTTLPWTELGGRAREGRWTREHMSERAREREREWSGDRIILLAFRCSLLNSVWLIRVSREREVGRLFLHSPFFGSHFIYYVLWLAD